MTDYDSPWKEALDVYFKPFLALFFPWIDAAIDWSRGYESLDKEFQQLAPGAEIGRRHVDKLVRVWRLDGVEQWVLVHVEVQTSRDPEFALRMYVYNYRVFDRYNREVVSLAVLADDEPAWRPACFRSELWGCERMLAFPCLKLLDFASDEAALETSGNAFAQVALAHLKALETRHDAQSRRAWKVRLVRGLYERGFSVDDVRQLFRLLDWLMELPPPLDGHFWNEVKLIQEVKKMPFITTPERIGRQEGIKEGRQEGIKEGRQEGIKEGLLKGIECALELKHGADALRQLMPEIRKLPSPADLERVLQAIKSATSLDELRRACFSGGT